MTRSRRTAAVSAVVMSLGLSGMALLATAPLTASAPADAAVRLVVANPSEIPGCDVDPGAPCEEPTPVTTVTVTASPEETETTPAPQQTVTTTVTVPPATKTPKPPKTTAPPETTAPPVPTSAPVEPPPVVDTPPATEETTEPVFPTTEQSPATLPTAPTEPTGSPTFEDTAPAAVPYEIRNAASEFDGATLSGQLAIPALILVLLVLFAVLIFEGRLRRLAHAAAIRRAGPRALGHQRGDAMGTMGYPAGPGYGPAPGFPHGAYQGGAAYAPIISFVPMQMYAPVYPEGYAPEQYPQPYEQPTAYLPQPGYEQPPTGYVEQRYGMEQQYGQAPYTPTGPDAAPAAFQHRGAEPYDGPQGDFPQGPGEFPGAPFPQEPAHVRGHTQEPFFPTPDRFGDHPRPGGPEGSLFEGPGSHGGALGSEGAPFPHGPEPLRQDGPQHPYGPAPQGSDFQGGPPSSSGHDFQGGPPSSSGHDFQGGPPFPPGRDFQGGPVPQGPGEFPGAPFPLEPPHAGAPGQDPLIDPPPSPESTGTAVYPLPGQDTGKKRRGLFRRPK
ncbi:hypothetical protein ACWDOR_44735 [Streptosporangium canum]|uniref:hypothetical protein n=1 Tax=Streptosporangium canum TaxID=324952 RepID=UPI00369BACD8